MERRNTWTERDFPILDYLVNRFEDGAAVVKNTEIGDAVGVPLNQIGVSLGALHDAGYVAKISRSHNDGPIMAWGITERARREVGTWPTPDAVLDRLIAALDEAERSETDPARRDKVVATRQALTGFLRDVAVGVIAGQIGTPR